MDFVVFDGKSLTLKLIMSDGLGSSHEVELLKGFYCNDRLWCYDFDNDGDIDILVPIDKKVGDHDNGNTFLVYFENDGNGNFKRSETWIDGDVRFFDCIDFDADGKYEIMALNELSYIDYVLTYELCFYEIPGKNIADTPECFYQSTTRYGFSSQKIFTANVDNSGKVITWVENKIAYTSTNANQRPSAPGKPQFMYNQEEGTLKLFWDAASDAETPTADLTYEIRVGTAPGLDDVVAVDALPDGRRRNLSLGANGHQLYHTFNVGNWSARKYYISVQAVDPNRMGSPFSEYAVFEKNLPATDFIISASDNTSVGDTISLQLFGNNASVKDVTWRLDGGEMLDSNADKTACRVKFNTPGKKYISVAVTDDNGTAISKVRTLQIYHARVDNIGDSQLWGIYGTFDLDADGSEEFLASNDEKIMEQNEAGEVSMVKKLYNSNLPSSRWHYPVDANRDGLVDLFAGKGSSEIYMWTNNGNKDLDISEAFYLDRDPDPDNGYFVDLNNDGRMEIISHDISYYSNYISLSDDCRSSQIGKLSLPDISYSIQDIDDYNGDGLVDLFTYTKIYYNNGDMTFRNGELLPRYKEEALPTLVGDFDNDGKLDAYYDFYSNSVSNLDYSEAIVICYGNGRTIKVPCHEGKPFSGTTGVFDFDNNGFIDFCIYQKGWGDFIVYINSDYTYTLNDCEYEAGYDNKVFHCNDGSTCIFRKQIRNIANERPSAPSDVHYSVGDKFVNIAWTAASDKETPTAGLKYNISIKKKGVEGEGAYILSPMNLGKDNVSVPSDHRLLNAPKIAIPLASIPAGEYEVKVQAVDGRYVTGPFSQTYMMTVPEKALLEAPASAVVGNKVEVRLLGNAVSPVLDFGADATITPKDGNAYDVVWSSTGMKSLNVNGVLAASLMVYDAPEAEFTLPAEVLEGSTVNVMCPSAKKGSWEIVSDGETAPLDDSSRASDVQVLDDKVVFTISGSQGFALRHTVAESYGSTVVEHSCAIDGNNARPSIDFVTISHDGACNEIHWTAASMPAGVETVNIYRETSRVNRYELIGSAPVADGKFSDTAASPKVKAECYLIACPLPYGESAASKPHRSMHLQLNKGLGDAINLMWSKYEGREVVSYRIYGGDSEDALQAIESVSGNNTSYTADGSKAYYAVGVVFNESKARAGRAIANADSPQSNVAATADAQAALLANALVILSTDGNYVIDLNEKSSLQMSALLSPAGVTVNRLDWYISNGSDIATVDANGLVTAYRGGEITVNAATRDGSGLSASCNVTILKLVSEIMLNETEVVLSKGETFCPTVMVYPEDAPIPTLEWTSTNPNVAKVENGAIVAVANGEADIIASLAGRPEITATCHVSVRTLITEISLNSTYQKLKEGDSVQLKATVYPKDATNATLAWSSSDPEIATVNDGIVLALKKGEAHIFAAATDGSGVTADCYVLVLERSGIEDVNGDAASVYVSNRTIHFDNVAGLACRVVQIDGSELYFDNSDSVHKKFAPSAAGTYIVVVGSKIYKIMILN